MLYFALKLGLLLVSMHSDLYVTVNESRGLVEWQFIDLGVILSCTIQLPHTLLLCLSVWSLNPLPPPL